MTYNHRIILRTASMVLFFVGIAMIVPLICAVYYEETDAASGFFIVALCACAIGFTVFKQLHASKVTIKTREGYFVTFLCWLLVCIVGALPYILANKGISFVDGFFESVAGWTTTGASVIDMSTMPRSLILWKAICNWLGGMGILVLTVSLFPVLGAQGQKMAAAEIPGPEIEKFATKMAEVGKITYRLYIIITTLEFCLLAPSGMGAFNAIVNTLSSISTSGIIDTGTGGVDNFTPYVKTVIAVASVLGSINFMAYFCIYKCKWGKLFKMIELKVFLIGLIVCSILVSVMLYTSGTYDSIGGAFGDGILQTISFGSTSGFTVSNVNFWPTTCKMILLILVLVGGCANSTAGSVKVIRAVIFFKLMLRGVYKRIHPNAMKPIMIRKQVISAESASSITVFILLYFCVYLIGLVLLSLENMDLETTFSAALGALSNNGGFIGGTTERGFSIFSGFGKIVSAVLMLCGRLEIYAIIVLFSRSFWNSDRARA